MTVRPAMRRRAYSLEELADLANVPPYVVLERLGEVEPTVRLVAWDGAQWRYTGTADRSPKHASWTGSAWRLSDVAWRKLLGGDFARVLELGGSRALRREREERERVIAGRGADLDVVAGFYGENL